MSTFFGRLTYYRKNGEIKDFRCNSTTLNWSFCDLNNFRVFKITFARLALYLVGRHGNYFFDIFRDILVKHKTNYQKYRKMKHFRYLIPIYLWFLCIFWVLNCIQYFCSKAYVVNRCRSMPRTLIKQKTHIFSVLKW